MTAPLKPIGRTLAEFQPLKPAEQELLEACRQGVPADISDKRPETATDNNTVRAAFLRFLALGGDEQAPVHEHGVQLAGAWIEGGLDIRGARVPSALAILDSHFDSSLVFIDAKIAGMLYLGGCQVPGLVGDRLSCEGSLFLHSGFTATGEVRLLGAQIGRDLNCSGAKLVGREGNALSADSAGIKGIVFLNEGFTTTGKVRLAGAQIGGDLVCSGAILDGKEGDALFADGAGIKGSVFLNEGFTATGQVRLVGVQLGGDLDCSGAKFYGKGGYALLADGMVVKGTLFFRSLSSPVHGVSLASSHVGELADDQGSWDVHLNLDGFVYGSIVGGAPTDAATRLAWLDKQYQHYSGLKGNGADFRPQPWRQLAHVLREMGHTEDARQVVITFEHRLRKANLIGQTPKHWGKLRSWLYRNISRGAHWLFWVLTGYGYRPLRLIGWMFGVWLVCALFYWYAALAGVFGPSDPLVFQNPEYKTCRAGNWYLCEKLPEEYTGFSPLAYSLDVILPFVDLQQEKDWSPLIPTPKDTWYKELFMFDAPKHCIRLILWFEILFGWVASLLLVAVVSGLTKRREE